MGCRVITGRNVKTEDTDPRCLVEVCQVHGPFEALEVLAERLGDPDLPDRRTDRAESEPSGNEQFVEPGVLSVGQIQDVGPMDGAEFDVLDTMMRQDIKLLV